MKFSISEKIVLLLLLVIVLLTVCFFLIIELLSEKPSVRQISFAQSDPAGDERIDLNSATADELKTLEGIGDKTADKIIEYRETIHPFSYPSDILNVDGVGVTTYENIKDKICVR